MQFLARHHDGFRELGLAAVAALAYFGIRNLTAGSADAAYANADGVMGLERTLHLAWERWLQAQIVAHDVGVTLANWTYIWGHWPVIVTVAVLLFRFETARYRLLRNAILVSGAIGFLFFAFLPVAPPRLADPTLVDTVTLHSSSYRALQPPGLRISSRRCRASTSAGTSSPASRSSVRRAVSCCGRSRWPGRRRWPPRSSSRRTTT